MPTGRVKFIDRDKGFGMIKADELNIEIFVHVSELLELIIEDGIVIFDIVEGKKGLIAVKVRRN
jgi:cold shock protein